MPKPNPQQLMEAIVASINRELRGRGVITLEFVALIRAGLPPNESHPMTDRVRAALKEAGL